MADILGKSDALNYDFSLNNLQNINPVSLGLGNNTPTLTKPKMVSIPEYSQTSLPTNKLSAKDEFWNLARNYEDNVIKDKELLGYTYNPADNSWTKPAGNPRSFNESHWLSRAKLFGFDSLDKVKEYLKKLGVELDGMFGSKTEARHDWYQSMKDKGYVEVSTPNGEFAFVDLLGNTYYNTGRVLDSNKAITNYNYSNLGSAYNYKDNHGAYRYDTKFGRIYSDNTVYNPNTKQWGIFNNGEVVFNGLNPEKTTTITPGKWANKTLNDLYNSGKFRKPYTGLAARNITIAGKKYPVVVGVGKGDGVFADASFAYDLNSGKILRLQETTVGTPLAKELGNYGWVDVHDVLKEDTTPYFKPIVKQQGGKMNNQEEMQKAFMAFLILDAAEQGMQIQSEQDLQAYAEQLGEEGIKAKYQEFMLKMLGQTPAAKYGAKLNYLKQLKGDCPEGYEVTYFKEGGMFRKGCKICEAKKAMLEKGGDVKKKRNAVEEFKKGCKMKK